MAWDECSGERPARKTDARVWQSRRSRRAELNSVAFPPPTCSTRSRRLVSNGSRAERPGQKPLASTSSVRAVSGSPCSVRSEAASRENRPVPRFLWCWYTFMMWVRRWPRPSCLVAMLCVPIGIAHAQTNEASKACSPVSSALPPSPFPATIQFLAKDPWARLTYSIEVDASRRLLPALPPPDRLSTHYQGHFEPVCVAPCSMKLPPGNYSLGMADEGHKPVLVKRPLVVRSDTTVVGHYQSNAWRRGLGMALIATSVVVGGLFVAGSAAVPCPSDGPCNHSATPLMAATGILSLGTLSGILLITTGSNTADMVQQ